MRSSEAIEVECDEYIKHEETGLYDFTRLESFVRRNRALRVETSAFFKLWGEVSRQVVCIRGSRNFIDTNCRQGSCHERELVATPQHTRYYLL